VGETDVKTMVKKYTVNNVISTCINKSVMVYLDIGKAPTPKVDAPEKG
jgi:hypothetical protein